MSQDKPLGRLFKIANGHFSYDIEAFKAGHIFPVATRLEQVLGFEPTGLSALVMDCAYLEMQRGGVEITVGWDIWSGLFIMAKDEAGDEAVREIAEHFEANQDVILAEISAADERAAAEAQQEPEP